MMRMRYSLSFLLLSLSVFYTTSFTTVSSSPPNSPFSRSQKKKSFLFSSSSGDNDDESDCDKGPVLVVGATGKVGRLVVKQLLEKGISTRALVRNEEKARELFLASDDSSLSSKLEIITHDIATTNNNNSDDDDNNNTKLEESIKGCKSVISVVGTMRFSKLTDFLPFPRFLFFKSKDVTHPYRVNYLAQIQIAELCVKHKVQNVVRLTGLSTGLSAFSFVSIIFSSLLSMTSRYHYCAERDMKQILLSSSNNNENNDENVNFYVLRPGGLSDETRNDETTSLQISTDTKSIPPPARVGRADVASLAIELCNNNQSNNKKKRKSCVLATRWTGTDIKPKSQGTYQDGFKTAKECVESLDLTDYEFPEYKYKPYVLASGLFVYSFIGLALKLGWKVISVILSFVR